MTITLTDLSANFGANADYAQPPVTRGILGYFDFGGTLTQSAKNLIDPGTSGMFVGAPPVTAENVRTTGFSSYFDTGLQLPANYTVVMLAKAITISADAAGRTAFFSDYAGADGGSALYIGNPGTGGSPEAALQSISRYNNAGTPTQVTATALNVPNLLVYKVVAQVVSEVAGVTNMAFYDLTDGLSGAATPKTGPRVLTGRNLLLGSGYTNAWLGQADISGTVVHGAVLSADELAQCRAWLVSEAQYKNAAITA